MHTFGLHTAEVTGEASLPTSWKLICSLFNDEFRAEGYKLLASFYLSMF